MAKATFRFRPTRPSEETSQDKGLAIAKNKIVGARKRKIAAASFHLGPRRTKTRSSAKSAQAIVIGKVRARTKEYPFRKYLLSRMGSSWTRESAENATSPTEEFRFSVGMLTSWYALP